MKIISEHHEPGWGEVDLGFASNEDRHRAAEALSAAGFSVAEPADTMDLTISTSSPFNNGSIDAARQIVAAL